LAVGGFLIVGNVRSFADSPVYLLSAKKLIFSNLPYWHFLGASPLQSRTCGIIGHRLTVIGQRSTVNGQRSTKKCMLKNYFKIAWRNLKRDRQFTFLNLLGLSIGLTCALFIWLWVSDEWKMDKNNKKDNGLYQVMQNMKETNGITTMDYTAGLLANSLKTEMPEVEYAATVIPASWFSTPGIISSGETRIKAGGQFVSKDYFNMFDCDFIQGGYQKLISDKQSIAISDELAIKLFHTTQNVIGKTIEWNQSEFNGPYLITGIFEKNPSNVSDKFDLLFNFDQFIDRRPGMKDWGNSDPSTFLLLKKGVNIAVFNAKIKDFMHSKEKDSKKTLFVRKFSDRYLYGQYKDGVQAGGRISYVKLFSAIALFILAIACINFMNLSTANATRRIKEVGIKKVVGAGRVSLILQYLGESILMSFLSVLLAILLIYLLLPEFNSLTGKNLVFDFSGRIILTVLIIAFVTGVIAGSYPALYISGFRPALILKGNVKTSIGELWIRKGLVIFQFTLSVTAIVAVLIVYKQVNYIQTKNLGYNRDNIIDFTIPLENDSTSLVSAGSFVNDLKNIPGVIAAGSHYHNLTGDHGGIGGFQWLGKDPSKDIDFANLEVGNGFLQTVGIKIKEGRNFSDNLNARNEIIFNESAITSMGLKDPIGKKVKFWNEEKTIVGVAKDFNFESLYHPLKPAFFQMFPVMPNVIVKIKAGTERQTIEQVRKTYASFYKGLPFDYKFLDEEYQILYVSENRVAILSKYFAGLAILISCLGLFGLAAFTAQRRQKEIGIRKVVGASVGSLLVMLSKDFLKLVLVAVLIAFPLVWWAMNDWLSSFAYRIPVGTDVFIIAGGSIILITLITISFKSVKAAVANPVHSLRSE
jgi:putative ABC transport system permease protein